MSGTACDAKAGTREAVANFEPVHSETMCILPFTRCAEDAFTDALHVFSMCFVEENQILRHVLDLLHKFL